MTDDEFDDWYQQGANDDDKTASEMFGDVPPGEPVKPRDAFTPRDYRTAPRFRYRADGRPYPKSAPKDEIETELPLDQCPDGSPRCARRDGRRAEPD